MALVLFFTIILIASLMVILISNLKINIQKFSLSNEIENTPIIKEFEISIGIYILNKIKIFNKNIDKNDLQKAINSKKINNIKNKFMKKGTIKENKQDIDILKNFKVNLEKIELDIELGTEDVVLTSFLVVIVSILISMGLAKSIKKYDNKKYKYKIEPRFCNQNLVKIKLNSIIDIKLVNIIIVFFKLLFRRNEKYERTSNRRAYVDSYEQYSRNDRCKYNYRRTN